MVLSWWRTEEQRFPGVPSLEPQQDSKRNLKPHTWWQHIDFKDISFEALCRKTHKKGKKTGVGWRGQGEKPSLLEQRVFIRRKQYQTRFGGQRKSVTAANVILHRYNLIFGLFLSNLRGSLVFSSLIQLLMGPLEFWKFISKIRCSSWSQRHFYEQMCAADEKL